MAAQFTAAAAAAADACTPCRAGRCLRIRTRTARSRCAADAARSTGPGRLGGAAPTTATSGPPAPGRAPSARPSASTARSMRRSRSCGTCRSRSYRSVARSCTRTISTGRSTTCASCARTPSCGCARRVPRCIDWDLDAQAELIGRIRGYAEELKDVARRARRQPREFVWGGGPFSGFDACVVLRPGA